MRTERWSADDFVRSKTSSIENIGNKLSLKVPINNILWNDASSDKQGSNLISGQMNRKKHGLSIIYDTISQE